MLMKKLFWFKKKPSFMRRSGGENQFIGENCEKILTLA